ncbi:hypothetical protein [Actinokineospora inagensis]|uniref:hypothetical protein n=1 Tax=Actinokineospora inagensis TaxID=103730 RepID=UPI0003F9AF08|nr:hypothetical protein [Actinokineospora inagensis]
MSRVAAIVTAAVAAMTLHTAPAGADGTNPVDDLTALATRLAAASGPEQVRVVLQQVPPVLDELRETTESQDALHLLANTQGFLDTASVLPVAVVQALLPSLLNLLGLLVSQGAPPQLPLIPLPYPLPQIQLPLPN